MGNVIAELASRKRLRVAGLMSGTSADGVDVAIVDFSARGIRVVAFGTVPYPPRVREQVFRLFSAETGRAGAVCHLNAVLGEVFAAALVKVAAKAGVALKSIHLVGSHGQTVHHLAEGRPFGRRRLRSTLQIGEPCIMAERTGITTVADFRPRDMAAGGQGAPLVPYADYVLFRHDRKGRAVQNIGGIANVTHLPPACRADDVVAFDTGPGNMIVDRAVSLATHGRRTYDRGGRMAARGSVNESLLVEMMRHPYFRRRPPKSTGRETFGCEFTDDLWRRARRRRVPADDIVATVTALTVRSIADAYRRFLKGPVDEVILCGGGARNRTMVTMLADVLAPARVRLSDELGVNADAREAIAFAVLARETLRGAAGNVPSATGARRRVVLGKVIPAC